MNRFKEFAEANHVKLFFPRVFFVFMYVRIHTYTKKPASESGKVIMKCEMEAVCLGKKENAREYLCLCVCMREWESGVA